MNKFRRQALLANVGQITLSVLTIDELSELAKLHLDHPKGLPSDIQYLFVRHALTCRLMNPTRSNKSTEKIRKHDFLPV